MQLRNHYIFSNFTDTSVFKICDVTLDSCYETFIGISQVMDDISFK